VVLEEERMTPYPIYGLTLFWEFIIRYIVPLVFVAIIIGIGLRYFEIRRRGE
jgi:hypothetical protein